jgi:hypothetical protein
MADVEAVLQFQIPLVVPIGSAPCGPLILYALFVCGLHAVRSCFVAVTVLALSRAMCMRGPAIMAITTKCAALILDDSPEHNHYFRLFSKDRGILDHVCFYQHKCTAADPE